MRSHRHAILCLIAQGRITSDQAERLLAVCNDGRETLWLIAACALAAGLAQLNAHTLPEAIHGIRSLLPASFTALHHAAALAANLLGGIQ
jgi:hypothetical protein